VVGTDEQTARLIAVGMPSADDEEELLMAMVSNDPIATHELPALL